MTSSTTAVHGTPFVAPSAVHWYCVPVQEPVAAAEKVSKLGASALVRTAMVHNSSNMRHSIDAAINGCSQLCSVWLSGLFCNKAMHERCSLQAHVVEWSYRARCLAAQVQISWFGGNKCRKVSSQA
jgi:hypothetical protein